MNAKSTSDVVSYQLVVGKPRRRIVRPMDSFLDGVRSLKEMAEIIKKYTREAVGEGAVNITEADMHRACGSYGSIISEKKMTPIIKFLNNKRSHLFNEATDVKKEDSFFKFHSDSLRYIKAMRELSKMSYDSFAKTIDATPDEVRDAEKEQLVRQDLLPKYKKLIGERGWSLQEIK